MLFVDIIEEQRDEWEIAWSMREGPHLLVERGFGDFSQILEILVPGQEQKSSFESSCFPELWAIPFDFKCFQHMIICLWLPLCWDHMDFGGFQNI